MSFDDAYDDAYDDVSRVLIALDSAQSALEGEIGVEAKRRRATQTPGEGREGETKVRTRRNRKPFASQKKFCARRAYRHDARTRARICGIVVL